MQSEIHTLKNIFDSNNIPVSLKYLDECILWCKTEILSSNYTLEQLRFAVYEQWLSLDLRQVDAPVLPPCLSEKKYMVLDGKFSLQLMEVIDISKPKYWQLQQIRKQNVLTRPTKNETGDTVGTGKRVLQLTLTDGVQYITAMEYKPISILNINLTPGCKIRLSGPVTIRRGRLLLEDQNIRILGGEVESLLVSNAAENILARALNLPENLNPQVVDANLLIVDQETDGISINNSGQQLNNSRNQQNNTVPNATNTRNNRYEQNVENSRGIQTNNYSAASTVRVEEYPTEEDFEMLQGENQAKYQSKNEKGATLTRKQNPDTRSVTNKPNSNQFIDPYEEEIELLMDAEREFENTQRTNNRKKTNKTQDLFEDDLDLDQIDHIFEMTKSKEDEQKRDDKNEVDQVHTNDFIYQRTTKHLLEKNTIQHSKEVNPKANLFDEFINEDDLFSNLDIDNLDIIKKHGSTKSDIISITELLQNLQHITYGLFKIRAKFKAVIEKLTLKNEEYKLTIMVEDENNEIVCRVHSDVVSKWAELTPVEISGMKTSVCSQDAETKRKVERALQSIKDGLVGMNHVMEIQIEGNDSVPIIKRIIY